MKKIVPLLLLIFLAFGAFSQDRIYYKNGTIREAKVLELSKSEIVFKRADNLEGPTYREFLSTVDKLVFANGTVENFAAQSTAPVTPASPVTPVAPVAPAVVEAKEAKSFVYKKNILGFSITDVIFRRVGVSFEHIFANGYLGCKIPVTFGLASNQTMDVDYLNSYSTQNQQEQYYYSSTPTDETKYTSIVRKNTFGLELNVYPFGQHAAAFFVGPAFYYGNIDYTYQELKYYVVNPSGSYPYYDYKITTKDAKGTSYSGMINTGFAFKSSTNFSLNLQIGLGFRQNNTEFEDYTATIFNPAFQVGYTF